MPFSNTASLRREIETRLPERPFTIEFWDGTSVPSTSADGGPDFSVRSPRAIAHALRAPGQLGLGRAYVSGELEVDDIDEVIRAPRRLAAARARQDRPAGADAGRGAGAGPGEAAAASASRAAPERQAPQQGARRPRRPPPLRRLQRVLRALPRADDGLQLRDLARRRDEDAGAGAGGEARHRRPQARRSRRASASSTSAAAGAASRSGRRPSTAPASSASPSRRRRPKRRGSGPRRPGSPTASRSASWTTATCPRWARSSTRSPASAWSSTSARPTSTSTPQTLATLLDSGGRLLNHGITRLRHTDPEAGDFSERYVFPDAAPLHLSRNLLALERAGFIVHHVEDFGPDYAETLQHWAQNLDANLEPRRAPRRSRTDASLAPLPADGAQRLRERVLEHLSGPLLKALGLGREKEHGGHELVVPLVVFLGEADG